MKEKNEVAHYPEITEYIKAQMDSNFRASGISDVSIYWENGELTSGIRRLIKKYPDKCSCLQTFCANTPPLDLDIFGVFTDGVVFEIVILEVKLRKSVGLSEWSQLIGYGIVADSKYGLLVNVNAGASGRLTGILATNIDASRILRLKANGKSTEHLFGFMQWNTLTQNFEYSNIGQLGSLSALSKILIDKFG